MGLALGCLEPQGKTGLRLIASYRLRVPYTRGSEGLETSCLGFRGGRLP